MLDVFEGNSVYGTSKSSYARLEGREGKPGARMIIRHSQKIDETKMGARSRFVESIFIENDVGERFLFPTQNLAPARAMAQHVNQGGTFADQVGSHILRMAADYADLTSCSQYVYQNSAMLPEGAFPVMEACRSKMSKLRKTFEKMYRPSGYAVESVRLGNMSAALMEGTGENALTEMRSLLTIEGLEISESILEAACKACGETEVDEARQPNQPTVSVLGRPINADAWKALVGGRIELSHKVPVDPDTGYSSKTAEMLHFLHSMIPCVRDDSLMNLLSHINNSLQDERNPEVAKKMRMIAGAAVKAAGVGMDSGVPEKNSVIREFAEWVRGFSAKRVLAEDYGTNPYDADTSDADYEITRLVDGFDVEAFAQDFVDDHRDDDNSPVSKDTVMHAIEHHIITELNNSEISSQHSLQGEADRLLEPVSAAIESLGIMVSSHEMTEARELSREDILLPRPNQGDDLRREVIKPVVKDPVTGKNVKPDNAYISRMKTLAGR